MSKWSQLLFPLGHLCHLHPKIIGSSYGPSRPGALRNLDLPKGPSEEGCFHWVIEHQSEHLWSSYCSSRFVFVPFMLGNRIVVSYHTLRRILPGVMCHDRGDSKIWSKNRMESNLILTKMPGVLLQNISTWLFCWRLETVCDVLFGGL